jgi:hypothetical protein
MKLAGERLFESDENNSTQILERLYRYSLSRTVRLPQLSVQEEIDVGVHAIPALGVGAIRIFRQGTTPVD